MHTPPKAFRIFDVIILSFLKICKLDLCNTGCTVDQYEAMTENTIPISIIVKSTIFWDVTPELTDVLDMLCFFDPV
jgi:hypothetical protein